ncbi:alpha-L-arabinofuranosidase C-terminal domain-containing protein [Demequina capsici]|uniref:non-reducing end alpha-L-arabinofuranosidase n=1 Tax=Demequina capsici TaxID=3075620 RepID=A0AA96FFE6_9MICO|nr:alpha-L-arabinofuranosidase C-terminal domain-containing protein [Demequina sp. PMTSA13]WNM27440.1 alpha-L-arabinofuranosidase C-terminal domain-containing protein [Demequina sp. PMTSA13]
MAVLIDPTRTIARINPALHGQFIEFLGECIDGGIWVGPDSEIPHTAGIRQGVLDALKELEPPVLRWPGGCYADTYHWRDGIGPREQRPTTFNENFGTYELDDHAFGTDEYLALCEAIGAQPWINVNMMTGTPAEAREWMEYCNRSGGTDLAALRAANGHEAPYGVRLWGIGNEPWGGGGTMTPSSYVDAYRAFASSMPRFTGSVFETPATYPIASGPDGNKPQERVTWTRDFFRALTAYRQPPIAGYDLHFYNWNIDHEDDTPTAFDQAGWDRVIAGCLELEDVIVEQWGLIEEGLDAVPMPESSLDTRLERIDLVVGEWGNWHRDAFFVRPALRQQVTMRDAITTALTLDILQRHADKISIACNAQTVNVLNSLILTDGDATVLTPNYDVFMMYKAHRGATALAVEPVDAASGVHAFASVADDGTVLVNLTNPSMTDPADVTLEFAAPVRIARRETLAAPTPTLHNTVGSPDAVRRVVEALDGDAATTHVVHLPAGSVTVLHAMPARSL